MIPDQDIIKNLLDIKKSLLLGAEGGVTDTAWIVGSCNETVVDRIDFMLIRLGLSIEQIEKHQSEVLNG